MGLAHALTSVRFNANYLRLPVRNADPALRDLPDQQAEAQLKALPAADAFAAVPAWVGKQGDAAMNWLKWTIRFRR